MITPDMVQQKRTGGAWLATPHNRMQITQGLRVLGAVLGIVGGIIVVATIVLSGQGQGQ